MDDKDIITAFYNHTLDLDDLEVCQNLVQALLSHSMSDIAEIVSQTYAKYEITTADIPQYSSLDDCFKTAYLIEQSGLEKVGFVKMGFLLVSGATRKSMAYQKYGENQAKMAVLFGLLKINPKQTLPGDDKPRTSFSTTAVGKLYNQLSYDDKENIKVKLMFRCKLMQNYFLRGRQESLLDEDIKHLLSPSTYKRRGTNIRSIKELINKALGNEL